MKVVIYRPSKNAMQSGRAKTGGWAMEAETETPRTPEPLSGWISAGDTLNQIRMSFRNPEEAAAFARKNGWDYTIQPPHERRVVPRNYVDNFRYIPAEQSD